MMNCSLLISTYNWPQALELCLKSVFRQSVLPTEILIADDGSRSETADLIMELKKNTIVPIKHIWHEDYGFRKCIVLNKAIAQATTDYIIQIDGDIILDKHFVEDHLNVAEKNCFIRGSRSHIEKEYLDILFSEKRVNFNFLSNGIKHRFNAFRFPPLAWLFTKKKENGRSVRGCNFSFWKTDFIAVNGYNNDLKGWGHEDEELATRMVNNSVFKKAVKLRCIQYHIYHPLASRSQENQHNDILLEVQMDKVIRCKNGYEEILTGETE